MPWWVSLAVLVGMLALTALAALGPALARRPALGRPGDRRRPRPQGRCEVMPPIDWPPGCACRARSPSGWPPRSPGRCGPLVTVVAIVFGATAVIFAVGIDTAPLTRVEQAQTLATTAPVQLQPTDLWGGTRWADPRPPPAPTAALRRPAGHPAGRPAVYGDSVTVPGISPAISTRRASAVTRPGLGYAMVTGRWYAAPGEVDVNSAFLTDSGLAVGATTTVDLVGTRTAPGDRADRRRGLPAVEQPVAVPPQHPYAAGARHRCQHLQGYDVGLRPGHQPGQLHPVGQRRPRAHGGPWRATAAADRHLLHDRHQPGRPAGTHGRGSPPGWACSTRC